MSLVATFSFCFKSSSCSLYPIDASILQPVTSNEHYQIKLLHNGNGTIFSCSPSFEIFITAKTSIDPLYEAGTQLADVWEKKSIGTLLIEILLYHCPLENYQGKHALTQIFIERELKRETKSIFWSLKFSYKMFYEQSFYQSKFIIWISMLRSFLYAVSYWFLLAHTEVEYNENILQHMLSGWKIRVQVSLPFLGLYIDFKQNYTRLGSNHPSTPSNKWWSTCVVLP